MRAEVAALRGELEAAYDQQSNLSAELIAERKRRASAVGSVGKTLERTQLECAVLKAKITEAERTAAELVSAGKAGPSMASKLWQVWLCSRSPARR